MLSKGEMWVFDSSCITQPQSQISTDALKVTARCSYELCCQSIFDSVAA